MVDHWPESSSEAVPRTLSVRLAIMDAAHKAVLRRVLVAFEAAIGIGAAAHLRGEPTTMREMELRSLQEREYSADAMARAHVGIDFENISTAVSRAGMLAN